MEPWELLQVLLFLSVVLSVSSSDYPIIGYDWLLIDCGSSNETILSDGITKWRTDQEFINTGKNIRLIPSQNFSSMNTLRFFPDGKKNCYKLPLSSADFKFLFRAGFFYGNYDGLSKPPSFKLEIDGNLWANVTTSMSLDEPVYHELIYMTKKKQTTVCLTRNSNDEVPFISSLESKSMIEDMYRLMENNTALYLHSRINYGANRSLEQLIGFYEECCNRIWKSKEMTEYLNLSRNFIPYGSSDEENYPPWIVMATAIQAKNVSDSIYLSVNFSLQAAVEAYFVLYFMDPIYRFPSEETSKVEIYIDSQKMDAVDVPNWDKYENNVHNVVSLYPVRVSGSANVTISPANGSTMGPILNAMEVFYVIDAKLSKGGLLQGLSLTISVTLLHLLGILVIFLM